MGFNTKPSSGENKSYGHSQSQMESRSSDTNQLGRLRRAMRFFYHSKSLGKNYRRVLTETNCHQQRHAPDGDWLAAGSLHCRFRRWRAWISSQRTQGIRGMVRSWQLKEALITAGSGGTRCSTKRARLRRKSPLTGMLCAKADAYQPNLHHGEGAIRAHGYPQKSAARQPPASPRG